MDIDVRVVISYLGLDLGKAGLGILGRKAMTWYIIRMSQYFTKTLYLVLFWNLVILQGMPQTRNYQQISWFTIKINATNSIC